ncbi:MAG TPA: hypothetical protein VGJ20_09785 [Xanthobacteraceae bacterium]
MTEGTTSNWRFDNGLSLRLTFHAPNLTVERGSQRQQVLVSWCSPYPPIIRPHFHCPTCDRGCYALFEVGGIFMCRICGQLDYACRHINRHTPQLNRLARLRKKIRADSAPFSPLPLLSSLRPRQRKIVGKILALEQSVVASMGNVADDLEARAKKICHAARMIIADTVTARPARPLPAAWILAQPVGAEGGFESQACSAGKSAGEEDLR